MCFLYHSPSYVYWRWYILTEVSYDKNVDNSEAFDTIEYQRVNIPKQFFNDTIKASMKYHILEVPYMYLVLGWENTVSRK